MIVRKLEELLGTDKEVRSQGWTSRRLLLRRDGMGFSLHDTTVDEGAELIMHYKNHLEAVYCIEGEGEIEDKATGRRHVVAPGTVYALDDHDAHVLRCRKALRLVCVFNPPVAGTETHGPDGAYPLAAEEEEPLGGSEEGNVASR